MADQSLVNFIKSAQQRGSSKVDIEQALLKKGWSAQQIADAFAEASRVAVSYSPAGKPSNLGIWVALIVCVVLFIIIGTVLLLTMDECSSDIDCDRGYECDSGECVAQENECSKDSDCNHGYECNYGECVVKEVEPECSKNSDCGSGYECDSGNCVKSVECADNSNCGSGYECKLGECVAKSSTSTSSSATLTYPNYIVTKISNWVVSGNSLLITNEIKNTGDGSSSKEYYLGCGISNSTYMTNSYIGYTKTFGTDLTTNESDDVVCSIDITEFYYLILKNHYPLILTVNAYADYYNNIIESNESDNSFTDNIWISLSNFSSAPNVVCTSNTICESYFGTDYYCDLVTGSCGLKSVATAGCVDDNECVGFKCRSDGTCYTECVDDGQCAEGYECSSSVCVLVDEEEDTCSEVLPTCADGVDNDKDDDVDLADVECSDWTNSEEGAETRFRSELLSAVKNKTAAPSIGENNLFNFILKGDSVSLRTVALSR